MIKKLLHASWFREMCGYDCLPYILYVMKSHKPI
jgi:hypothetical protein